MSSSTYSSLSRISDTVKPRLLFPNGITDLTVDLPGQSAQPPTGPSRPGSHQTERTRTDSTSNPPRWKTKEFYVYYAAFIIVVPNMVRAVVKLSRESHPNYHTFAHRLRPGWLFGWKVDVSDNQWNTFRSNIPILFGLTILWVIASFLFRRVFAPSPFASASTSPSLSAPPRTTARTAFILAFAFPLLLVLHGSSLPKMLVILVANFQVSRMAGWGGRWTKAAPAVGWAFNLAVLFANETYGGYRWGSLVQGLGWLDEPWAKGILPRWHINWNITMLRLISFNMDYYWACTQQATTPPLGNEKAVLTSRVTVFPQSAIPSTSQSDRQRASNSHPVSSYSLPLYLAYALYPPLYLAGPIITFNNFLSQLIAPPPVSAKTITSYAVRFASCLLVMELVGHSMYVVAIKDESRSGAWRGEGPFELSMIGFWNLIVVWLKLLIPWRFFRLWALLDGVDPPENMVRCMANNYSTLGFWRSWHRSYNLWTVRYIYVPLGGAKHAILATLVVFTFVALWHDLSLKLLTWGWVISLFVLPEMTARKVVPYEQYGSRWWYRHVAALGGVVNVLMMMTANLIGFAIGTDGMAYMWREMVGTWAGVRFMAVACGCLFVAVQVMFEYREEERRRGINRRF